MDKTILDRANTLAQKIEEHKQALNCFEVDLSAIYGSGESPQWESTEPQIIIEYTEHDDVEFPYRNQIKLPMVLNEFLTNLLKSQIQENLEKLEKEFEEL